MTVWALATASDPTMLSAVMARMRRTAKGATQLSLPSVNAEEA